MQIRSRHRFGRSAAGYDVQGRARFRPAGNRAITQQPTPSSAGSPAPAAQVPAAIRLRAGIAYGLALLFLAAVYFGLLTLFSHWLSGQTEVSHGWQFVVILLLSSLLLPVKTTLHHGLARLFHRDRATVADMLRRLSPTPARPTVDGLAELPRAVRDALRLRAVAVALPTPEGWRITQASGCADLLGSPLAGPSHAAPFTTDLTGHLARFAAAIPMRLDERTVALLLLGAPRAAVPLTAFDLQVAEMLLLSMSGLIACRQGQARHATTRAELTRLDTHLAGLRQALGAGTFGAAAKHELRSALTLIVGHAELLVDGNYGALEPALSRHIETIHTQAESLVQTLIGPDPAARHVAGR
ncbi:MAG: hypothetical protein H7338_23800 [Candidatus Sericytochromatia bacterium]|nr:hypothetical protein [Candidatus Sericytochromatia bacterium]